MRVVYHHRLRTRAKMYTHGVDVTEKNNHGTFGAVVVCVTPRSPFQNADSQHAPLLFSNRRPTPSRVFSCA